MKWSLRRHCSERDYIMFLMGINTGLRVSDLLKLKIKEVKGKNKIIVKEGKTEKPRIIILTNIYEEINNYIKSLKGTEGYFLAGKGISLSAGFRPIDS